MHYVVWLDDSTSFLYDRLPSCVSKGAILINFPALQVGHVLHPSNWEVAMEASSRYGNVNSLTSELHCPYTNASELVRIGP